jgi:hypothetical protein
MMFENRLLTRVKTQQTKASHNNLPRADLIKAKVIP